VPHTRLIIRAAGIFCLIGAGVAVLGTYLTWYHIRWTTGIALQTSNVDVYQSPYPSRLARPFNTWSPTVIEIGAAGLAIIGLGALTLARRFPLFWSSIWIVIASGLIVFGALAARIHGISIHSIGFFEGLPTRGPGEAVTLVGAGLGFLAVFAILLRRVHAGRPRRSVSPTTHGSHV
jgi:hypothetical protein